MKHVVSFSGGRTSAYLVYLMEQRRINEGLDVSYVFMDTGAEHPKTYEFIKNITTKWKIPIVFIRVSVNPELGKGNSWRYIGIDDLKQDYKPWKDMLKKYGTPYIGGEFCTDRMKTTPFKKHCDEINGKGNYITWLGMRADEPRRIKEKKGFKYLADISDFDKGDVVEWWSKQDFDLGIDEHLGNCVFCIKKSILKVALATKDEKFDALKFASILNGKNVRFLDSRTTPSLVMYRGNSTLKQIIDTYQDVDRDSIFNRLRKSKRFDSGSCSESCEVFGNQIELFGEGK